MPIFYEEDHVKSLLHGSKKNEYISAYEMGLIACYFRHNLKMSMDQVEESLLDFCSENNDDFNKVHSYKSLKKALNMPTYRKLRDRITPIVFQSEMCKIWDTFDNHKTQGAAFAALIYSKFFWNKEHLLNYDIQINKDREHTTSLSMAQMLRLSKINVNKKDRFKIIHELHQSGLVTFNIGKNNKGYYKISFAEIDGKIQTRITELYDISQFFPYICDNCGGIYNKKSNSRHQFCDECYQKKRRLDNRNRQL